MTSDSPALLLARPTVRPKDGRVLEVGPLMPSVHQALANTYDALELPRDGSQSAFLERYGDTITVAVTSGKIGVDAGLLRALPSLQAIINFGVGYDTTDVEGAAARGIVISNTPDVLTDCVADTAAFLLLDVLRQFSAADRFVRRGDWADASFPLSVSISGKRVGIVGLGRIGSAIARRLEGFGCAISYHNRSRAAGVGYPYFDQLVELAADSDVLVVAAAGGASSDKLVSAEVLAALGPRGYLVNIARGSVVDEEALIAALLSGDLAGAGLDVYADEPDVPEALRTLDNVVLLPHLASGTIETRRAMADLTLANVAQFLADGRLVTPVTLGAV